MVTSKNRKEQLPIKYSALMLTRTTARHTVVESEISQKDDTGKLRLPVSICFIPRGQLFL